MKKTGLIALLLLATVACIVLLRTRDPRQGGRPLTSWLEQASDATLEQADRRSEAEKAVRAIDPQKVLPRLLELVAKKENRISSWIDAKCESFGINFFHQPSALQAELQGIVGFEILGTNGAPAIEKLTKLLGDDDKAFAAFRCLNSIGKPAEAALCLCLTNRNMQVKVLSIDALASVTDDVEVYIARVKDRLNDPSTVVRWAAIDAVGCQTNAPELAIPLLLKALGDSDDTVSSAAVLDLANFGTNVLIAFPTLTNFVISGQPLQQGAAMQVLTAIAPREALPLLSNVVVNGSAAALGLALKNLKSIAPELTLQMTLAQFRSDDPNRRSPAISFAGNYRLDTPGIADALKAAAHDEVPQVARRAVNTMRQLLEKEQQNGRQQIQMPSEPVYQGKPLGDWLKMRTGSGEELSTNAVEALRQMGTNVIPALLARVTYKDPVFGLPNHEVSMEAVNALISMRNDAKPALPRLAALMNGDDKDVALWAMAATLGTGPDALPCILQGLTNQFGDVRNEAIHFLTNDGIASIAQRRLAVPLLLRLLDDPAPNVRSSAASALNEIDPTAAAKAGIKSSDRRQPNHVQEEPQKTPQFRKRVIFR